jgi:ketosteroid isomerase-like protein
MTTFTRRISSAIIAASVALAAAACAAGPQDQEAASEVTTAWTKAFNAGDSASLAALYAEDARSLPPSGPPIVGRSSIESYWRDDIGEGGATTTLTPVDTTGRDDLVLVEGTYQVNGTEGVALANGQYQQLWTRAGDQWQVQREIWRIDPTLQREVQVAERLTEEWTSAYNAGDATKLVGLYAEDAALSTVQDGTINGRPAIESFWTRDFGAAKPASTRLRACR